MLIKKHVSILSVHATVISINVYKLWVQESLFHPFYSLILYNYQIIVFSNPRRCFFLMHEFKSKIFLKLRYFIQKMYKSEKRLPPEAGSGTLFPDPQSVPYFFLPYLSSETYSCPLLQQPFLRFLGIVKITTYNISCLIDGLVGP